MKPEDATLEQLKARAYDVIVHIQALQSELQLIETELNRRAKEAKEHGENVDKRAV